jgi:antitoxin component YwqK of YwqJK toxin-antitoxin module
VKKRIKTMKVLFISIACVLIVNTAIAQSKCDYCYVFISNKSDTIIYDSEYLTKVGAYPSKTGIITLYKNGEIASVAEIEKGKKNGIYELYENGEMIFVGSFRKDLKHGVCVWYDEKEKIKTIEYYQNGKQIRTLF